jgi:phosphoribosylanthranilate isomerase
MFKVKVCGITNTVDARAAVSLGADMVGLIVYKGSPRYVTQAKIKKIIGVIPPTVDKVLVAVGTNIVPYLNQAKRLGFEYLQWHGPITKTEATSAKLIGVKIIHAVPNPTASKLKVAAKSGVRLLLLDNTDAQHHGGTGRQFDWSTRIPPGAPNIVLAGGINADNVFEGVKRFKPLVVDVNSGIESSPGKKSPKKLKQFFRLCDVMRYGTKK